MNKEKKVKMKGVGICVTSHGNRKSQVYTRIKVEKSKHYCGVVKCCGGGIREKLGETKQEPFKGGDWG